MERTEAYRFTVKMKDGKPVGDDALRVDDLRFYVKEANKFFGTSFYVKLQGRLGENNPTAEKYRTGRFNAYQCIRLPDAQTADVYVYQRR